MANISISFIAPKIGAGKWKNQYATTNNIPKWYRWYKPKISQDFKQMLAEWYMPTYDNLPFNKAEVTFKIKRNQKKKMDPDAFGASAFKWAIDMLVEQKYLVDDDKVRIILEPTELDCKDTGETIIHMEVKFYDVMVK